MSLPVASTPVLRNPPFALLWLSRVLSIVAFQMQAVAVGWQLYALTGSALDLGLLGLAQFVPMILLTLLIGHVADRCDRRLVVGLCQGAEACAAAALALGSLGGWLGGGSIFVIAAVTGAARAFESPTMAALVPGLVPGPVIPRATAWFASANQSAQILGPALGGLLYILGPAAAYAAATALFVLAAGLAAAIRMPAATRRPEPATLASLFAGFAYVRRNRVLLGILSLDLFAVLFGGATALLPVYARDILDTGPWGLGLLRSAPALGALAMSLWLARRPLRHHVGPTLFGAVTVFGLATVIFGLSTNPALSLAALFVLGASDVISVVIRFALVQMRTPDEMRGRVSAVNSMFIGTSNQLGEFESGLTAALFGAVPAVLLGGIGTVAVALLWARLFPELRRLRSIDA